MAKTVVLNALDRGLRGSLARSFQSGHVNFLLGSGASVSAIQVAGPIEKEIADLLLAGDDAGARTRLYEFLLTIQEPTNKIIENVNDAAISQCIADYEEFLVTIERILTERRTTLLPKQASVFTTNYDLFIEQASLKRTALRLNDGFSRAPSLNNRMEFSSRNFFTTTYNTGNLYAYRVEIPSINLLKLHGSLSWKRDQETIVFNIAPLKALEEKTPAAIASFVDGYAVVLPQAAKFRTTLMDRTYYELLRMYANELDRENTLLVTFGFSFDDEHIRDITKRALKNPTLRVVVFAFNSDAADSYAGKFSDYSNVEIVKAPEGGQIGFAEFNKALRDLLPQAGDS